MSSCPLEKSLDILATSNLRELREAQNHHHGQLLHTSSNLPIAPFSKGHVITNQGFGQMSTNVDFGRQDLVDKNGK